jgi:hypothetical protein
MVLEEALGIREAHEVRLDGVRQVDEPTNGDRAISSADRRKQPRLRVCLGEADQDRRRLPKHEPVVRDERGNATKRVDREVVGRGAAVVVALDLRSSNGSPISSSAACGAIAAEPGM